MPRQFTSARPDGAPPRRNPLAGISVVLDGEEFKCEGRVKLLDESELALLATQAEMDWRSPHARAATAAYLQLVFGWAEYSRFKAHVDEHDTPDDVVTEVMATISAEVQASLEEATGRPTGPSSPSSPGPQATAERTSRLISLSAGDVTVVPGEHTAAEIKAMRDAGQARPARAGGGKGRRAG